MIGLLSLKPNPGSDMAVARGCLCPVIDNAHGQGAQGRPGIFWYTEGCPIHCLRTPV